MQFMDRSRLRLDHGMAVGAAALAAAFVTNLSVDLISVFQGETEISISQITHVCAVVFGVSWLVWLVSLSWDPMTHDRCHLKRSLHDSDADLHAKRRVGKGLPPAYPDGWRCVCLSHELKPGCHRNVTLCGKNVVVFRPETGSADPQPTCLSAYCSHLGAHIGAGGRVVGCEIECPFHQWRFGKDGKVCFTPAHAAGKDRLPGSAASIPSYPCVDRNGLVLVWFSSLHATNEDLLKPALKLADKGSKGRSAMPRVSIGMQPEGGLVGARPGAAEGKCEEDSTQEAATARDTPSTGGRAMDRAGRKDNISREDRIETLAASVLETRSAARGTRWEDSPLPPWFEVPVIEGMEDGGWVFHGSTSHVIDAHACEMPENGADAAHLGCLHQDFVFPVAGWLLEHGWDAKWKGEPASARLATGGPAAKASGEQLEAGGAPAVKVGPERSRQEWSSDLPRAGSVPAPSIPGGKPGGPTEGPFRSTISIDESMRLVPCLGGARLPVGGVTVEVQQCGPAVVFLKMQTDLGPLVVVETVLTTSPLKQLVRHSLFAPSYIPRLFCRFVLDATARQFERDMEVWANKRYEPRPVYTRADPYIRQFRSWYRHFFRYGCPTFAEVWAEEQSQGVSLEW